MNEVPLYFFQILFVYVHQNMFNNLHPTKIKFLLDCDSSFSSMLLARVVLFHALLLETDEPSTSEQKQMSRSKSLLKALIVT